MLTTPDTAPRWMSVSANAGGSGCDTPGGIGGATAFASPLKTKSPSLVGCHPLSSRSTQPPGWRSIVIVRTTRACTGSSALCI